MAADLRESLRQRARTQVQQERTLSPTSSAAPDADSSMDDALADFKKKAAAGRTRRASISIGGGSNGAGRTRSASLSPVEVSAAQPTQLDSFAAAVPLLCRRCAAAVRCCAAARPPLCPLHLLTGGGGFRRALPHGEDL